MTQSFGASHVPFFGTLIATVALFALGGGGDGGAAASPAESSTVAYWRLQRGVRDRAASEQQLIVDSSGNDQHGVPFGQPAFRRAALRSHNLALEFASDAQRVFVPDDPCFELTRSLTIEALVWIDAYPSNWHVVHFVTRGDSRPGHDPWNLGIMRSGQAVFYTQDDVNEMVMITSRRPLPVRRWLHVAATLDDATGTFRLFVDGKEVAQKTSELRPGGKLPAPGASVGIGNLGHAGGPAFRGKIAAVRISNVALRPGDFLEVPGEGR